MGMRKTEAFLTSFSTVLNRIDSDNPLRPVNQRPATLSVSPRPALNSIQHDHCPQTRSFNGIEGYFGGSYAPSHINISISSIIMSDRPQMR